MVFKWHNAFKEGRENVEDDPRSGRPISSTNDENVEVVRAVMVKDRRLRNVYLQDWQLSTPFTKMSWNDFEDRSSESERTLQTTGCFTTTTRPLTLRLQFGNFWRKKNSCTPTTSLQPRSSSMRFLPLPKVEIKVEGSSFRDNRTDTKTVTDNLNTLTENDFQYCYEQWKKRWNRCVSS